MGALSEITAITDKGSNRLFEIRFDTFILSPLGKGGSGPAGVGEPGCGSETSRCLRIRRCLIPVGRHCRNWRKRMKSAQQSAMRLCRIFPNTGDLQSQDDLLNRISHHWHNPAAHGNLVSSA